ncbi:MAG: efflux transporter outer membrane subunit [Cardiobacteriaceae bacterium]|nr:efflux transporter outer membrane subunit [Cardiobacteriaceae bacterium]
MKLLKTLPLAILLAACANPHITQTPNVDLPSWETLSLQQNEGKATAALGWREFFRDAQLQRLIEVALQHNHDLRKAAINVEIVQQQWSIQDSASLPTVVSTASTSKSHARKTTGESYSVGVGMSNFELDFFGKTKALSEKALNQYLATREARDSAQLSIVSAVAKTYYQLRTYQAQKALATDVLKTREESYRLSKLQHQAGLLTDKDLLGVQSLIENAKASLIEASRNEQQAQNNLAQLIGQPLEKLNLPEQSALSGKIQSAFAPLSIPTGMQSSILLNRPDIRQAEYQLKAAGADITAARAALYPSISLSSQLGFSSTDLSNLLNANAFSAAITPSLMLPIFDRDRLHRAVHIAESAEKIAVENYQAAVQSAFYEVANTLIAKESLSEQYQAVKNANDASQKRLKIEQARLQAGVSSVLDILDAQRESYSSAMGLLGIELQMRLNEIDLYKATGGGLSEMGVKP